MRDVGDLIAVLVAIVLVFCGVPLVVVLLVALKRRREGR
jgi:hypothetical protein